MPKDILEKLDFVLEKLGWDSKPKGWKLKSMRKFGKTLTGKDASEKGFFTKCVAKLEGEFDEPEKICASLKDSLLGTTKWRGKAGSKPKGKE